MLKNCFSTPKLLLKLRSAHCYSNSMLKQYDDVIKHTLQAVWNVQLRLHSVKQHCRSHRAASEFAGFRSGPAVDVAVNDLIGTSLVSAGGPAIGTCTQTVSPSCRGHMAAVWCGISPLSYILSEVSLAGVSCRRCWPPHTTPSLTTLAG